MGEETKVALLKEEYFHLLGLYNSFYDRAFNIKGWGVTVGMAGVGLAFVNNSPEILLLASVASLLFWIMEAQWRMFQEDHGVRLKKIEEFLEHGKPNVIPLKIFIEFETRQRVTRKRVGDFWRVARRPSVLLPHIVPSVGGVLLWLLNQNFVFIVRTQ